MEKMKGPFCVIVIGILFFTTNGQCPVDIGKSLLSSCEGMKKHGQAVFVDFYKISRPCTCIVTPSFDGKLLLLSKRSVEYECNTKITIQNVVFSCPMAISSDVFNVNINQSLDVRADYKGPSIPGTFHYCIGFQQNKNDGLSGNLSVICGSPSETTTTTTVSSPTIISSSIESTSVATTDKNTDVTMFSNTVNSSFDSLSMDSSQDDPEMLYIVAGSAAIGAILLVGLVVFILILMKRSRSGGNKNRSSEGDMVHTNKVFDKNVDLPDNPLYLSSQPMDEVGYSSDQEKQLGLPPTDSKTKKKINSDYDVPPNNKPIDHGATSMPVYAVPKRGKDRIPEVTSGYVYAEVCKPNRSTAKDSVRKSNEDGLLYMEVEQDTAATKQANTNDKNKITEGVCYAEIKHT